MRIEPRSRAGRATLVAVAAAVTLVGCTLDEFAPVVSAPDGGRRDAGAPDACVATGETCDGTDEDCDGRVDEALFGADCANACGATGREVCRDGAFECDAPQVPDETCDGSDEDCDGMVDEALSRSCANACGEAGTELCEDGAWTACDAPPVPFETCDATDDDCDGTIDEGGPCAPCGVAAYGGHSYLFCEVRRRWPNARADCQMRGYDLVVIDDEDEGDWVMTTALARMPTDRWIGLNLLSAGGSTTWHWLDDPTAAAYTNWGVDDPMPGEGECALFEDGGQVGEEAMRWAAELCTRDHNFVCESP